MQDVTLFKLQVRPIEKLKLYLARNDRALLLFVFFSCSFAMPTKMIISLFIKGRLNLENHR